MAEIVDLIDDLDVAVEERKSARRALSAAKLNVKQAGIRFRAAADELAGALREILSVGVVNYTILHVTLSGEDALRRLCWFATGQEAVVFPLGACGYVEFEIQRNTEGEFDYILRRVGAGRNFIHRGLMETRAQELRRFVGDEASIEIV